MPASDKGAKTAARGVLRLTLCLGRRIGSIILLSFEHWVFENVVEAIGYDTVGHMRDDIIMLASLGLSLAGCALAASPRHCETLNSCSLSMFPSTACLHPSPLLGVELLNFLILVRWP